MFQIVKQLDSITQMCLLLNWLFSKDTFKITFFVMKTI